MDRSTAIDRLRDAYAAALRLQDEGYEDTGAARRGLAPAAVGPPLNVAAAAKLHAIILAGEEATRPFRDDTAPSI